MAVMRADARANARLGVPMTRQLWRRHGLQNLPRRAPLITRKSLIPNEMLPLVTAR
jgi:hypothetical protein